MTAPTTAVRLDTYDRDGWRCVSCGATDRLEWQHREASGQGGRGKKAPPLTTADGVTSCSTCNGRYEHDMQELALHSGWKLRRNRQMAAHEIPFWNRNTNQYCLPDTEGGQQHINHALALELLEAAGAFTTKGARDGDRQSQVARPHQSQG